MIRMSSRLHKKGTMSSWYSSTWQFVWSYNATLQPRLCLCFLCGIFGQVCWRLYIAFFEFDTWPECQHCLPHHVCILNMVRGGRFFPYIQSSCCVWEIAIFDKTIFMICQILQEKIYITTLSRLWVTISMKSMFYSRLSWYTCFSERRMQSFIRCSTQCNQLKLGEIVKAALK